MAGLNQYTRTLEIGGNPGDTSTITIPGNIVFISSGGPLELALRQTDITQQAEEAIFIVNQGDKIRVPFSQIRLINTSAAQITVTIIAGTGDFERPGVLAVPATLSPNIGGLFLVPSGTSSVISAQNNARRALIIVASPSNEGTEGSLTDGGGLVYVNRNATDGVADVRSGIPLWPGDVCVLETSDEVRVGCSQTGRDVGFSQLLA